MSKMTWEEQSMEWDAIAVEMIKKAAGASVTAYEVSEEQRKRAKEAGRELATGDKVVATFTGDKRTEGEDHGE